MTSTLNNLVSCIVLDIVMFIGLKQVFGCHSVAFVKDSLFDKNHVNLFHDPRAAVENADCVVTDTWVSMGTDASNQHNILTPLVHIHGLPQNHS